MTRVKTWILIGAAAAALAALFVYSGVFDVAADVPHSALVYAALEVVRDRSISVRSKDIQVPPLNDPKLIADGAEHYDAMCAELPSRAWEPTVGNARRPLSATAQPHARRSIWAQPRRSG